MTSLPAGQATAVVTGASSGIGRCYALRLASTGHNLLLVGRQIEQLACVRDEVQRHGVAATVISADLSRPEEIAAVAERVRALPRIDFLVNNAGFGTMGDFADVDFQLHEAMVNLHCIATLQLTHSALGLMRPVGRGTIVTVSSMSAFVIGPGQSTYAATKAMLVTFCESLQAELEQSAIRVQVLCPGFTRTAFHDRTPFERFDRQQIASHLWMSAEQVVEASLAGLQSKRVVCIPGIKNRLLASAFRLRAVRKLAGKKVRKR